MPMDLGTLVGVIASVFTAISLVPQLVKLLRDKKSEDVSILTLFVLLTEVSLWMYYGILKEDAILAISNFIALVINVVIVVYTIKFRNQRLARKS